MPNATWLSKVGIAKDGVNTTVASNVAAAAVTLPVASATGITTSSTVFICDGVNSESRAVSAVSSNNLTVAALTYAHNAGVYVYAQTTASLGPTDWIPVTSIDFEDMISQLADKGLRGSAATDFGNVDGTMYGVANLGGDVFPDTFGYVLGAHLGAVDFTGGTPNQFDFSVKNTGDTQPTPMVLYNYDGTNTRAVGGAKISEVAVKLDPGGLLTWTGKAMGQASAVVANATASYSTDQPTASWTNVATIGGSVVATLLNAELNLKRNVTPIFTAQGIQSPYSVFLGPSSVTGKATFVMNDDTELTRYLSNTQPSFDLKCSTGSGSTLRVVEFHLNKANYVTGKPVQGKDWVEIDVTFTAIANSTDATTAGTGLAPCKATLTNSKSTGTYQ